MWQAAAAAPERGRWIGRHGIERVALFPKGLGLIEIRSFPSGEPARTTAITALRLLADATVLVIDLRRHEGGDERMAALLTSLLFDTEPLYGECVYTGGAKLFAGTSVEPRCVTPRVELLVSDRTSAVARSFAQNIERLGRGHVIYSQRETRPAR
ncbi:MAG TPA: S41 family peptidase [Gemmatimonadaceae bacterium]|nr:S41 family peptidase [Gemmatimonadaceae bacterium]